MGTRKEKSFAFLWALVCALSFGIVACGDEAPPSGAETPESSSAMLDGGDFSAAISSSSRSWEFYSASLIGTQPGDSLKSGDTLVPQDSLSHDTDWVRNPDSVYYFSRLAIDGRVSALFGLTPNSSMRIEYLDTQSGISSNGVDSGSASVIEAFLPITYWKPYVRVSIDGIALDFPGASAVAGISLSALGDLTLSDTVKVDFVSTAELSRAETLVAAGQDLAVAMEQAATEVLRAFHMDDFADDLPKEEVTARYFAIHLLAASRVAEGDGFSFKDIAADIADDGLWSDTASRAKIADWALRADAEDAFASLRAALSTQEVGNFENNLRLFFQKELGIPECSSENAGTMLHVGNVASRYFVTDESDFSKVSDRFVCDAEGGVAFASDSLKDIVSLGTGTDGEVRPGAFSGNIFYTYDASLGEWRLSTELEKDSYFVQISATNTFVDIQDVYDGLKDNERVIFVIRHGKRGDDTSISGTLTSDGKAQAKDLGSRLTKHEEDFLLGASEFLRAHQTVEYIAIGRGQQSDIRDTFPELNDNWYEKNHDASEKAKSECGGGWELTSKYAYTGAYTTGENAAFYKLDERSVELIVDVLLAKYNDPSRRFVMLSSHDKVMVPLVAYCTNFKVNLRKYDGGKWLNYLAGVAIIVDELGNRRYVPVKGLDSAYM